MDSKMLNETVKYILLNEWDPIGINEFEEAYDEYDAYVLPICKMITEGKGVSEIREYLRWATNSMCVDVNEEEEQAVAEKLGSLQQV